MVVVQHPMKVQIFLKAEKLNSESKMGLDSQPRALTEVSVSWSITEDKYVSKKAFLWL